MKIFLSFLFMFLCIGLGAYILYRVQTGQSIIPSFAANGNVVQFDDKNPRFTFTSSPARKKAGYPHWDNISSGGTYVLRGGSAQQCNGLNNAGCFAVLDLTKENFNTDEVTLGFSMGQNRTSADIYVDGNKIGQADSHSANYILDYRNYKLWTSPKNSFTCGKHIIKIVPNQKTGTGQKAFTLDFADVRKCTPTSPPPTGDWQKIDDKDSRFDWGGNNPNRPGFPFWDLHIESGGYVLDGDTAHACRTDISLGCVAKINVTTTNFKAIGIGFTEGLNRTSADVFIDNIKIGEADSHSSTDIIDYHNYQPWVSPNFACGKHEIKIIPNGRTGINAKSFDMDYLQVLPCTPMGDGNKIRIEDNDSRFKFTTWDQLTNSGTYQGSGGTFHQTPWSTAPQFPQARAVLDLTTPAVNFDKFTFGYIGGTFRSTVDIYLDGKKLSEVNTNSSNESDNFADYAPWWTSPKITCSPHKVEFRPTAKTGQLPYRTIDLDFVDIFPCTPNQTQTHLVCQNNACVESSTATSDDPSCSGMSSGFSPCETPPPTPQPGPHIICGPDLTCSTSDSATADDPTCSGQKIGDNCGVPTTDLECQGNTNAPARCFDCKRDIGPSSSTSEINILDFSCFAKFYGKEVGKN